jgi:hypothetical protein
MVGWRRRALASGLHRAPSSGRVRCLRGGAWRRVCSALSGPWPWHTDASPSKWPSVLQSTVLLGAVSHARDGGSLLVGSAPQGPDARGRVRASRVHAGSAGGGGWGLTPCPQVPHSGRVAPAAYPARGLQDLGPRGGAFVDTRVCCSPGVDAGGAAAARRCLPQGPRRETLAAVRAHFFALLQGQVLLRDALRHRAASKQRTARLQLAAAERLSQRWAMRRFVGEHFARRWC